MITETIVTEGRLIFFEISENKPVLFKSSSLVGKFPDSKRSKRLFFYSRDANRGVQLANDQAAPSLRHEGDVPR